MDSITSRQSVDSRQSIESSESPILMIIVTMMIIVIMIVIVMMVANDDPDIMIMPCAIGCQCWTIGKYKTGVLHVLDIDIPCFQQSLLN